MSCSSRMLFLPLFIIPIRFKAFLVAAIPFFTKNWGVSSMQTMIRMSSSTAGPATRTIQLMRQLSMREKKRVTTMAPTVKNICTNTEYFWRFQSPTTSPKKKKQILMAASHPQPLKKSPTATMQMLTLVATMMVPRVQIDQETTMEDFLPKLSEKKEMTIYPIKAPKQVQLLTRSIMADLLQRQLSQVAREVKSLPSRPMKSCHLSSGSSQTQSEQSLSESSNPWALQSKDLFRKRKAVLSRMIPVTNQQMRKMTTRKSWYLPLSPTLSMRWKQLVGNSLSSAALRTTALLSSLNDITQSQDIIQIIDSNKVKRIRLAAQHHQNAPLPNRPKYPFSPSDTHSIQYYNNKG